MSSPQNYENYDCHFLVACMLLNHSIDELRCKVASAHTALNLAMIMLNYCEEFGDKARAGIICGSSVKYIGDCAQKAFNHANKALYFLDKTREELRYDCIRTDSDNGVELTERA